MIPVAPFALYNWIFTGNPAFPFYNAAFQSPYYAPVNFKDIRWGPESFLETLAWPFIVVFDASRFGEIVGFTQFSNGRLAIGYIVIAVSLFAYRKTGLLQKRLPMALCLLVSTVLWSATSGYVRYGMVIGVLAGEAVSCARHYTIRRKSGAKSSLCARRLCVDRPPLSASAL